MYTITRHVTSHTHSPLCILLLLRQLEDQGWINKLQSRLTSNSDAALGAQFIAQMDNAHRQYAAERWATLSAEDRATVEGAT